MPNPFFTAPSFGEVAMDSITELLKNRELQRRQDVVESERAKKIQQDADKLKLDQQKSERDAIAATAAAELHRVQMEQAQQNLDTSKTAAVQKQVEQIPTGAEIPATLAQEAQARVPGMLQMVPCQPIQGPVTEEQAAAGEET